MNAPRRTLCPSAQPETDGAVAFGVIDRGTTGPRMRWIEEPVPVSDELLAKTGLVPATRVLRIAGTCQESACVHFDGSDCQLAKRIVSMLEPATEMLPPCTIRRDCRWFAQEGLAACRRCPQVVTECVDPDEAMAEAARPRRSGEESG